MGRYGYLDASAIVKLARREEREVLAEFGETYRRYMIATPAFFPRLGTMLRTKTS